MTAVSGENAKRYRAVRLDSLSDIHKGELISADDQSGRVDWKDHVTGETKTITLGAGAIRLVPR